MWVAVGLGVFFRGYHIEKKIYWYDEVFTSLWVAGQSRADLRALQGREYSVEELRAFTHRPAGRGVAETVAALVENDPQHPPLYYVLAALWVGAFGDSFGAVRALSALVGVLVLPLVYWLTLELREFRSAARLATALVALSPFHVLYAQEARQYSLWTAATLLSSAALWRALASPTARAWWFYAVTVTLGIYTHALHVVVCLSHAGYVVLSRRSVRRFALATAAGLLSFAPWVWVMLEHRSETSQAAAWAGHQEVTPFHLSAMWIRNVAVLFFDGGFTLWSIDRFSAGILATYAVQLATLGVVAYALYRSWRARAVPAHLFLLTLVFVPVITLGANDLVGGGMRSGVARYMIPSLLGIQIAVAFVLAIEAETAEGRARSPATLTAFALLTASLVSCLISAEAETWWTKNLENRTPNITSVVNRERRPLLLLHDPGIALSFSQKLDERVRVWIVGSTDSVPATDGAGAVFVYRPTREYRAVLARKGYEVETIDQRSWLYRLRPTQ